MTIALDDLDNFKEACAKFQLNKKYYYLDDFNNLSWGSLLAIGNMVLYEGTDLEQEGIGAFIVEWGDSWDLIAIDRVFHTHQEALDYLDNLERK